MQRDTISNRGRSRPTIGYLSSTLANSYHDTLFRSVLDVAQERDVNVMAFFVGAAWTTHESAQSRNLLFELVSPERVDGLVIDGTLAIDQYNAKALYESFHPLPLTAITLGVEGVPTVLGEREEGMRKLITHLVEVHGYRRIAFLQATIDPQGREARLKSYTQVLAEHGIPFDPELVVWSSGWYQEDIKESINVLLDERKVVFDAIVGIADILAICAMEALRERGIHVPDDVAVAGYDDLEPTRFLIPPLTTVHQPVAELARQAVEMLLALLAGDQVSQQIMLPTELVIRSSCGCVPQDIVQAALGTPVSVSGRPLDVVFNAHRPEMLSAMTQAMRTLPASVASQHAGQLGDAFHAELKGGSPGSFLAALSKTLRAQVESDESVAAWQGVISALRRHTVPHLGDDQIRSTAEDLLGQARVMVAEVAEQVQGYQRLRLESQLQVLRQIGETLNATTDTEQLVDTLAEQLPQLGIPSCFISLYEDLDMPAEWARLLLAYNENGRIELDEEERRFPSRLLVPPGLLPRERRHSLVIMPLHFHEEQFGFAAFEVGPRTGNVYESLRMQVGSAFKGVSLYTAALEARAAAEKADRLKTRLLANVSHELRTPLNIILGYTRAALDSPAAYEAGLSPALLDDLLHIQQSAEHQLRVVNDLLDLSRAEIDELDLYPELVEPRLLLEDAFCSMVESAHAQSGVTWHLQLPERLPAIQADPVRLRQVVLNLLSNASKFTELGHIILGAEVAPPHLHIWVQDTGVGIPVDQQERIFEPFVTMGHASRRLEGIGLGLSITRRLVALHHGSMRLESQPGQGSTFHICLPLPSLSDRPASLPVSVQPVLLLLSAQDGRASIATVAAEIVEFSQRQGLEIRRVGPDDDLEAVLAEVRPAALAWDLVDTDTRLDDWSMVQRLRRHPRLSQLPFILYGYEPTREPAPPIGVTSVVVKPVSKRTLSEAVAALNLAGIGSHILVVDDDPQARAYYRSVIEEEMPGYAIRSAESGSAALAIMMKETPSLVILDLMMPEVDGFGVLDWMRADRQARQVPVLILSNRPLTVEDVKRLERHARVTVHSKGILREDEIAASLRALLDAETLPTHTSALVKRAVAFLHQNYSRAPSRREIARAVGVSENYLSEIFRQELGLSPWEYLNRYRVKQAKELLRYTDDTIASIALQVGFNDPSYFGRVFRKLTGQSPTAYRESPES